MNKPEILYVIDNSLDGMKLKGVIRFAFGAFLLLCYIINVFMNKLTELF